MGALDEQYMTAKEVGALLKLQAATILLNWKKLGLPKPLSLGDGPRAPKRWIKREVEAYLAARNESRFASQAGAQKAGERGNVVSMKNRRRLVRGKHCRATA